MSNALIFDIKRGSTSDGPGLRTVVFFQGCNLNCAWCHNPEGKAARPQLAKFSQKCTGCKSCEKACDEFDLSCQKACGKCVERCPNGALKLFGKSVPVQDILQTVLADEPYYAATGGGVTFSGGECMLQIDAVKQLAAACKNRGVSVAVDTAGHLPYEYFQMLAPFVDLYLFDVKAYSPKTHEQYVGVDNGLILDNLRRLLKENRRVWVRIPVVQGVNDSVQEMQKIKAFLDECGAPEKVELLPYHALGEDKAVALGLTVQRFSAPSAETLGLLKAVFDN